MPTFKKISFAILALAFAATLAMTGCSDQEEISGDLPDARLVKVVGHYNIVKFNGIVYGVPHGISIDWQKDDLKKVPGIIIESSVDNVEKSIKRLPGQEEKSSAAPAAGAPSEATLVAVIGHYNIVKFNGNVYGAPHGIAVDWHKDDLPKVKGMIVGSSVTLVKISVIGRQISEKLSWLTGAKKT